MPAPFTTLTMLSYIGQTSVVKLGSTFYGAA